MKLDQIVIGGFYKDSVGSVYEVVDIVPLEEIPFARNKKIKNSLVKYYVFSQQGQIIFENLSCPMRNFADWVVSRVQPKRKNVDE